MKILFDIKRLLPANATTEEIVKAMDFMDTAANRVQKALKRHIVWAKIEGFEGDKYRVRDVRILEEVIDEFAPGCYLSADRIQVLLLEGWRTPEMIWTDENTVQEIAGIH
jgi:hypothetical protein